jgi:hypothetical protein
MKNLGLIFIFAVILISCEKKQMPTQNLDHSNITHEKIFEEENDIQEDKDEIMYVNSIEGLRIRNLPNINGERIGLLEHYEKVKIIREDNSSIVIDGIEGKWVYVITENNEGWVFNGYLTSSRPQEINTNTVIGYSIKDIVNHYYNYFNLENLSNLYFIIENPMKKYDGELGYDFNDVLKVLNVPREYKIINHRSYKSIHGDELVDDYLIGYGKYEINLYGKSPKYVLHGIVIKIDESNINLFPNKTIDQYIADDISGNIFEYGEDYINYGEYGKENDFWKFNFNNGILYKISLRTYMP